MRLCRILIVFGVLALGWVSESFSFAQPLGFAQTDPSVRAQQKKISGSFIQYQSFMMQLNETAWIKELELMKKAGLDTVVIQWLKADQNRFFPVNSPGNDPTEYILKYADANGIKVFLGIDFDRAWWTKWDDPDFLTSSIKKNMLFGQDIWQRYGKHPSFVGWYIPYEMSDVDFDDHEIENLQNFIRTLSVYLKKISSPAHQVSVSTFFEGKIPATAVQNIYSRILKGTQIDVLMVQDGVGAHSWVHPLDQKISAYFQAYEKAGSAASMQVWAIAESFSSVPDANGGHTGRTAAPAERLKEQIQVESPLVDKILTFDFFHYLSPYRGSVQSKLFKDFYGDSIAVPGL